MDINKAKKEISQAFLGEADFLGASVRNDKKGNEYVLVRLLKNNRKLRSNVRNLVSDTKIKIEISDPIIAY